MDGRMDEIGTGTERARGSSAPPWKFIFFQCAQLQGNLGWTLNSLFFFFFRKDDFERSVDFSFFFSFFEREGQFMNIKRKDSWTLNGGEAFIEEQRSLTLSWFLHSDAQGAFCCFFVWPPNQSLNYRTSSSVCLRSSMPRVNTGGGETYLHSFFFLWRLEGASCQENRFGAVFGFRCCDLSTFKCFIHH